MAEFVNPNQEVKWHWKAGGFEFKNRLVPKIGFSSTIWQVPYWSIVIPLTAITAFLLISKPRRSNQKKTDDPIRDEGGGMAT